MLMKSKACPTASGDGPLRATCTVAPLTMDPLFVALMPTMLPFAKYRSEYWRSILTFGDSTQEHMRAAASLELNSHLHIRAIFYIIVPGGCSNDLI